MVPLNAEKLLAEQQKDFCQLLRNGVTHSSRID